MTPCTPDCAAQPRRAFERMQVGCGITAARRRASRLAGLVGFPVTIAHRPPWHDKCHGSRLSSGNEGETDLLPFRRKKPKPTLEQSKLHYLTFAPSQAAAEQSGDRQRREKALPFLKEEKSEHERAQTQVLSRQQFCARHCELPLSKMGSKGLFPGVAVPHAFFGTFFRVERKYYPPSGRQPHRSRRSRRVHPHPGQEVCAGGRTGDFPQSKPSAPRAHKKSLPPAGPRRSYVETFLPIRASLLKEPPFLPLSLFSLTGRSH